MHRRIRRPLGLVLLLASALTLLGMTFAATASADPVDIKGKVTCLTVDPVVTQTLADAGIVIMPIKPATAMPTEADCTCTTRFCFPITEALVDPGTLGGEIWHSGGLTIMRVSDGAVLQLRSFRIDTVEGLLYGLVGDAYLPLLELDLGDIELGGTFPIVRVGNVGASLTETAAGALNATFGTELPAGLPFGVACVKLRLPCYGHTEVAIEPAILQALTDNKLQILPVHPASVKPVLSYEPWNGIVGPTLAYRFPITERDLEGKRQSIWHSGGLQFVNLDGCKWVAATGFKIDPVKQRLWATVAGCMWVKLFTLDFSGVETSAQGPYTVLSPVGLVLTRRAASALNRALCVDIFECGMRVGEARVVVRI
ncbi:MAG TPA: hypothetical protein VLA35_03600 [Thermoleophilia bacterium]|nr:hypothetical protein [Thermoleophilia bacterium]